MKIKNNPVVAFFVEGPTEIEFYKAVISYAHRVIGSPFSCSFEWVDMRGIGNYKSDSIRRLKMLQKKNPNKEIYVFLCIDTDVFELSKKPPINKATVRATLINAGAKKVQYIEARQSIEEWFLSDLQGVLTYLKLPQNTKRPSGNGQEALKALFRKANKMYIKGSATEGFIEKLDIAKILSQNCAAIQPICKLIGFNCQILCHKH